jgi:hypothetical protein
MKNVKDSIGKWPIHLIHFLVHSLASIFSFFSIFRGAVAPLREIQTALRDRRYWIGAVSWAARTANRNQGLGCGYRPC